MAPQPNYLNLKFFFQKIYEFLTNPPGISFGNTPVWLTTLSFYISLALVIIIIYLLIKVLSVDRRDSQNQAVVTYIDTGIDTMKNERWESVGRHMDSENPNDWRLAIIEADAMLDDLVKSMGYEGETMGERLKNIEVSDFTTLQQAWEAHKVRNKIAHEGSAYLLTKREGRRVISLYEKVFREFAFV